MGELLLVKEVQNLHFTDETEGKRLYIDILNYGTDFFPIGKRWSIPRAYHKVGEFVEAARNASFTCIKCFIDDSNPSIEAAQKWKTRREAEIRHGKKEVPQGFAVLLGDLFRMHGVEVLFSGECDNDDTLAFHAHHDRAVLLSGDKDFFRYVGADYILYDTYKISSNVMELSLTRKAGNVSQPSSPLRIGSPPSTRSTINHISDGRYKRGSPSPLVRALNISPLATIAPLRRASFVALGIKGPITEIFPEWNEETKQVVWSVSSDIYPETDAQTFALLSDPDAAARLFFPNECDPDTKYQPPKNISKKLWERHVFCMRSLAYELCVQASHGTPRGQWTLLELWAKFIDFDISRPALSTGVSPGRRRRSPLGLASQASWVSPAAPMPAPGRRLPVPAEGRKPSRLSATSDAKSHTMRIHYTRDGVHKKCRFMAKCRNIETCLYSHSEASEEKGKIDKMSSSNQESDIVCVPDQAGK